MSFKASFVRALAIASFFCGGVYAAEPVMNYLELEAVAKASINAEVADLNNIVATMFSDPTTYDEMDLRGYKKRDLKLFQKFNKPDGVDSDVLYNVCVLTKETVTAITSRKITRQNLKVTANINAVHALNSAMNVKFFRIAERACRNAKARFIERLRSATQNGAPVGLPLESIENISSVVFFPTDYAKPTLKKALFKAIPFVLNGFLIISKVTSFAGIVIDSVWLSISAITGSSFAIKNLLPGPSEIFKQRDISEVDAKNGIRIDLNAEEAALLASGT